ncbi:MAG: transcription elongation factor GreA [Treponemataceae bacterium]|nr:transcription elongation factor GreA [Treponemataceae bacterium]
MSEELVKSVQDLLKEETFTRAALSQYSKSNFIKLSEIIEQAHSENCIDEVKGVADEHLVHTKNSVIALYISGMLGLKKGSLDNSSLVTLINLFLDQHRSNVVTYLCESILAEDENNKFALHTLADCYAEEDNEKIWEVYEHIVKIDREEANIAKILGEKYEKEGNLEVAVEYYKKALNRFITKAPGTQLREMWTKLVSLVPEEIEFFYMIQRKIAKTISADKSASMMQELYVYYREAENWNVAIDILKLMLSIDDKDSWARRELVDCFKGKYAKHSQLDDYIRVSNLASSWRNVFEAIADFEKHISFDVKNFVFHRSWGVGVITKVEGETITINFGKKQGVHDMSLKMAINALQPLAKNHIWVLKATKSKEVLRAKVKDDKEWTLKTIIRSFDNSCDFKRIKAELVPSILTTTEWTGWSTAARKLIDSDPTFGVNPDDITQYTVRDHAITKVEKLANEFKAQKQFFARIDILMKFANTETENGEPAVETDLFGDMLSYFTGFLHSTGTVTEQTIASYLVVRNIIVNYNLPNPGIQLDIFGKLFEEIENPSDMYLSLKDTRNTSLRKDFLTCIEMLPNWSDVYIKLFPTVLSSEMLTKLINKGHTDKVKKLAATSFENYRDYRAAAIYFFKECQNEEWFQEIGISYEKQMITLVNIMDLGFREINNHYNTTENRKLIKQIETLLFGKDAAFLNYMLDNGTETINRLYTLVSDVNDLDPVITMKMRSQIQNKYPDFQFRVKEEKTVQTKGLIVTQAFFDKMKAELDHIATVEIPANAKEIGEAIEKGDLRENAEYKAARERQTQLNSQATRLQEDIDRAQVFDPSTATTAYISFGTVVTLHNELENTDETYTILGPRESDPDNGIISYMSPMGMAIMNKKPKEKLNFVINERNYSYTVAKIKIAKL